MRTSIIIITINRKITVLRLLENIAAQTVQPDQVVLIETGTLSWATTDVPLLLQEKFYHILATGRSLASARTMGQNIATGEILFFFDDDIILLPTYIENAAYYLAENIQVMAIGGKYSDASMAQRKAGSLLIGRMFGIYANGHRNRLLLSGWADYVRGNYALMITNADWLFGCNFVVRAEAFSKVQFEEQMLVWSFLEDLFFGINMRNSFGDCMMILPSLQVIHAPPNSSGKINKFTLRMRILYRFILWRDHISSKYNNTLVRFILGMIANLFLMIKQEKRFWVVPESIRTIFFVMRCPNMNWDKANEFISTQN